MRRKLTKAQRDEKNRKRRQARAEQRELGRKFAAERRATRAMAADRAES